MADPVVVRVEIPDAEFGGEYEVDPDKPLVDLVRRIAEEENIPLVTRQGRPLAWEAEGPDWRPGKTGRTDLTRTQALSKIVNHIVEEGGGGSPLFMISLVIPGAADAILAARDDAKRQEIEERLAERQAERHAERIAHGEPEHTAPHMVPFQPDLDDDDDQDDIVTGEISLEEEETELAPPPRRTRQPDQLEPRPVESRIRRAGTAAAVGVGAAAVAGGAAAGARKKKRKKKAPPPPTGGLPPTIAGISTPLFLGGAAAATVMLMGLIVVGFVATRKPEPPPPEPTPEVVPEVVVDIPIESTPEPTPPPERETPPPRKFTTFYSSSNVDRNSSGAVGAQISSYAKGEVKVGYRASGAHTVRLKGRFDLYVGETASTLEGASSKTCKGAPSGGDTKVFIHWEGDRVTARVGSSRCGPVSVKGSGGFPGWKFEPGAGQTLSKLWASAPDEE
ncbi:MAG: hypothetical protein GY898_28405 [Proteobacteria bacterium]|nr:hypothetical protein [Pseudomonadota bacterium]